ncbi:unnamed protein product [Lathyrus sativus]|nr:unnamed protein product [Lathyrus sativus]
MEFGKKNTFLTKVSESDIEGLEFYAIRLPKEIRKPIIRKYEAIFDLVIVHVQKEGLTALAQFYDPELRCFHFHNFQIAPTLEEFHKILGPPKNAKGPFKAIGYCPLIGEIPDYFHIHVDDIQANLRVQEGFKGFSKGFFWKIKLLILFPTRIGR